MKDATDRLRSAVTTGNVQRRGAMTAAARQRDQLARDTAGFPSDRPMLSRTTRGTLRHIFAWGLEIPSTAPSGASAEEHARAFFDEYAPGFGLPDSASLDLEARPGVNVAGRRTVRVRQSINVGDQTLEVFGASAVVNVDPSGAVTWYSGGLLPTGLFDQPTVDELAPTAAIDNVILTSLPQNAAVDLGASAVGMCDPVVLGTGGGAPEVCTSRAVTVNGNAHDYLVGHESATVVAVFQADADEHKEIYYGPGTSTRHGDLVYDDVCHASGVSECPEPAASCDGNVCVDESFPGRTFDVLDYTSAVDEYFDVRHGRDGWDDGQCAAGGTCDRTSCSTDCGDALTDEPEFHRWLAKVDDPNFTSSYQAQWQSHNGLCEQRYRTRFGADRWCGDVVAHEFTHAVDCAEADLAAVSWTQSGVLNEAFPDVFGELIEAHTSGSTDWVHGSSCPSGGGRDSVIYYPPDFTHFCNSTVGDLPQVGHWSEFHPGCTNHWNTTIISKAGQLIGREPDECSPAPTDCTCSAGTCTETWWGREVEGIGEEKSSELWYDVLKNKLSSTANFTEFGDAMLQSAYDHYLSGAWDYWSYSSVWHGIKAIGLWTSDTSTGIDVASKPTVENLSSVKYVFYQDTTNNQVYYRHRNCHIFGSCSWSSPVLLDQSILGPSSAVYDGEIWVCFAWPYNEVPVCDRVSGVGNHSTGPDPPTSKSASSQPVLVVYDDELVLFYSEINQYDDTVIFQQRYTTSGGWTNPVTVHNLGDDGTGTWSIASGHEDGLFGEPERDLLYVVYYRYAWDPVHFRSYDPGTDTLGSAVAVPGGTAAWSGVSADIFFGRLHLVSAVGDTINYASCELPADSASKCTSKVSQDPGTTGGDVYLDDQVGDGRLYLWHRDDTSDDLRWRWKASR